MTEKRQVYSLPELFDLLDVLPVGLMLVDAEKKVSFLNRTGELLLGKKRSMILGKPLNEVFPEGGEILPFASAVRKITAGGKKLSVQTASFSLSNREMTALVFHDVSAYESLLEDKEELEAIFNSSYDEIYVLDGNGYTRRINKTGESYYGVETDKLIGRHYSEIEKEGYYNPAVSRLVLEEKKRVTIVQQTRTGKTLIVTGNPVFDQFGRIIRVVVNSRDISELANLKQRLEETEQMMENYRRLVMALHQEKLEHTDLIYSSPRMKQVLELADRVARVDSTVLITGESGVGKGVVASYIHRLSKRGQGPFITINCGAIPENLLESELFGYEPGAFTGARREGKKGLIEMGNGGTVFLDEVADLPLNLQVKLLQVIQDKKLFRVGGNREIEVNVRFITATNRNIQKMVKEGRFREDLYYRLNVVPVTIPPLRYRKEDISPLIEHFTNAYNLKYNMNKRFSPEALEILVRYHWPGNVREVENLVERLMVTTEASTILPAHIPDYIVNSGCGSTGRVYVVGLCPLKQAVDEVEKQLITMVAQRYKTTYEMAAALKVNQSTVVRKMQKYGFAGCDEEKKRFRDS